MPNEKLIYTITKECFNRIEMTHRYEHAFEKMYDALRFIGVWSNMKTMNGYKLSIYGTDTCPSEHRYVAEKENEDYWVVEKEEIVLRVVTLKLKEES